MNHPKTPPLPDTEVTVSSSPNAGNGVVVNVNLSRDNHQKDFLGEGNTSDSAVKDVIKKILKDKTSGEFIN